jgi:hypothetical protein
VPAATMAITGFAGEIKLGCGSARAVTISPVCSDPKARL